MLNLTRESAHILVYTYVNNDLLTFVTMGSQQGFHLGIFNHRFHEIETMKNLLGSEIVTGIQSKNLDYFGIIGH